MYCPNCGIEIHTEGAFCAKCRKNIAYLTKINETKPVVSDEKTENSASSVAESPESPVTATESEVLAEPQKEKPVEEGYFCNYCGTFVYPEDHFCYDCGKKTRPAYYKEGKTNKNLYIIIAAAVIVLIIIGYIFFS